MKNKSIVIQICCLWNLTYLQWSCLSRWWILKTLLSHDFNCTWTQKGHQLDRRISQVLFFFLKASWDQGVDPLYCKLLIPSICQIQFVYILVAMFTCWHLPLPVLLMSYWFLRFVSSEAMEGTNCQSQWDLFLDRKCIFKTLSAWLMDVNKLDFTHLSSQNDQLQWIYCRCFVGFLQ